jgi:hypothetical protein
MSPRMSIEATHAHGGGNRGGGGESVTKRIEAADGAVVLAGGLSCRWRLLRPRMKNRVDVMVRLDEEKLLLEREMIELQYREDEHKRMKAIM